MKEETEAKLREAQKKIDEAYDSFVCGFVLDWDKEAKTHSDIKEKIENIRTYSSMVVEDANRCLDDARCLLLQAYCLEMDLDDL